VRVLLDECVPKHLRKEVPEHNVVTVVEVGWSGITNGKLLAFNMPKRAISSSDQLPDSNPSKYEQRFLR
jgi:hypothetical protein